MGALVQALHLMPAPPIGQELSTMFHRNLALLFLAGTTTALGAQSTVSF
jgi:hypothetical protein